MTAVGRTSNLTAQARYAVKSGWVQAGFDAGPTRWNPYENTLTTGSVNGLTRTWTATADFDFVREAVVANGVMWVPCPTAETSRSPPPPDNTCTAVSPARPTPRSSPVR